MNGSRGAVDREALLCQFTLHNETIESCFWGPWGVVETHFSNNSGQQRKTSVSSALYRSELVRLEPVNEEEKLEDEDENDEPSLSASESPSDSISIPELPTTSTATPTSRRHCSEISASAVVTPENEMFPPLASGVEFSWTSINLNPEVSTRTLVIVTER